MKPRTARLDIERERLLRDQLEFSCVDDAVMVAEWLSKPNHPFGALELTVLVEDANEWRAVWFWHEKHGAPSGYGLLLTSADPEPPIGTVVMDSLGRLWRCWDADWRGTTYWLRDDEHDDDPESWAKIAGNYGPVEIIDK